MKIFQVSYYQNNQSFKADITLMPDNPHYEDEITGARVWLEHHHGRVENIIIEKYFLTDNTWNENVKPAAPFFSDGLIRNSAPISAGQPSITKQIEKRLPDRKPLNHQPVNPYDLSRIIERTHRKR